MRGVSAGTCPPQPQWHCPPGERARIAGESVYTKEFTGVAVQAVPNLDTHPYAYLLATFTTSHSMTAKQLPFLPHSIHGTRLPQPFLLKDTCSWLPQSTTTVYAGSYSLRELRIQIRLPPQNQTY
jgi:hypothetical protein